MKEFRVALLLFFSVVAARLLGECPLNMLSLCGATSVILVLFFLSSYFVDSLLAAYDEKTIKQRLTHFVLGSPYVAFCLLVAVQFISSISIVTIEYVASLNLLYVIAFYIGVYWINNRAFVKRLNSVFMITMLAALILFAVL